MPAQSAEVILLGTGDQRWCPGIGLRLCGLHECKIPKQPHTLFRAIRTSEGTILIDTAPDMRTQLLREKIPARACCRLHA